MEQKDIKILIVDDDASFGASLKESLIKADYKSTFLATTPNEAIFYNKTHFINCFIIDCLLPQMAGLDLALKFKEMGNFTGKTLFFMSGVFQKSEIFDEIQQKIQIKDFLLKPFSVDTLIKTLNQQFAKNVKNNFVDLIFSKDDLSIKKRLSIVSEIQRLHGFLLPQVIKLLLSSKISGVLSLKINDKKQSIYFSKGSIVFIELHQTEKRFFFGDILIKKNILSFEEIKPFLSEKCQEKIGKRLINANLISPHVIDIVTKEQIKIRLNTLIKDVYYDLSFEKMSAIPLSKQANFITQKYLRDIYIQYLQSMIPITYIKQTYLNCLNYDIRINPDSSLLSIHPANNEKIMDIFISIKNENHSIHSLLNKYSDFQTEVYFTVHSLLLSGTIYFQNMKDVEAVQAKIIRLKKISNNFKNQNYFEVLNISKKAKTSDIRQAYKTMSVSFYPSEANFQGSKEIKDLLTNIFSHIKKAHDILLDPQKRSNYELSLEHKNFEIILKSKQLFKKAKEALHNGNKKYSLKLLEKVMEIESSPPVHVLLYFIWSQLANSHQEESLQGKIDEIAKHFDKIPPEDRNTSLFYFVRGLFYKKIGDKERAINHLKYANHLDPLFKEAKQELQVLVSSLKKPVNIFKSDFKDVIKNLPFFKKKIG